MTFKLVIWMLQLFNHSESFNYKLTSDSSKWFICVPNKTKSALNIWEYISKLSEYKDNDAHSTITNNLGVQENKYCTVCRLFWKYLDKRKKRKKSIWSFAISICMYSVRAIWAINIENCTSNIAKQRVQLPLNVLKRINYIVPLIYKRICKYISVKFT